MKRKGKKKSLQPIRMEKHCKSSRKRFSSAVLDKYIFCWRVLSLPISLLRLQVHNTPKRRSGEEKKSKRKKKEEDLLMKF